jgi:hypothetical protein
MLVEYAAGFDMDFVLLNHRRSIETKLAMA